MKSNRQGIKCITLRLYGNTTMSHCHMKSTVEVEGIT